MQQRGRSEHKPAVPFFGPTLMARPRCKREWDFLQNIGHSGYVKQKQGTVAASKLTRLQVACRTLGRLSIAGRWREPPPNLVASCFFDPCRPQSISGR